MRRMTGLFWIWTSFSAGSAEVDGPPRVCVWWRAGAEREVGCSCREVVVEDRSSKKPADMVTRSSGHVSPISDAISCLRLC